MKQVIVTSCSMKEKASNQSELTKHCVDLSVAAKRFSNLKNKKGKVIYVNL